MQEYHLGGGKRLRQIEVDWNRDWYYPQKGTSSHNVRYLLIAKSTVF